MGRDSSQALPIGADQLKGGGRRRPKRKAQTPAAASPGERYLTYCPAPGCSLCRADRAELTRRGV